MSPSELYTREDKKVNGVFYTPEFLSQYLAQKTREFFGERTLSSVLDPACGDGMLLRSIVSQSSKNTLKCFGIDKDINAVVSSTAQFSSKQFKRVHSQFIHTDGLFPFNNSNSKEGWARLKKELKCKDGFDIIVSNPPWGAEMSGYTMSTLSKNFSLARGQFDIFDLFVEVIIDNLNENGIYGLILPDSVFSHEQNKFRCLLSKNTKIHLIARLGEKIFPGINRACVVIIGQKANANSTHKVACFRLSSNYKKLIVSETMPLHAAEKELTHSVYQERFLSNENCVFDIDLKTDEETTFNKILSNSQAIKKFVINTRGAEISKKGIVCKCAKCNSWMPLPKSKSPKCNYCFTFLSVEESIKDKIILNHNGTGNVKLKVGEDLYRFTSRTKSWINTLKKGINYKDLNIYKGDKILVRKTGVGITACIDYDNSITNQVVYLLKLNSEYKSKLTLEFILAVLNSRVMTYYLIKKYGENEWKSHPYLTQTMLINLPFPDLNWGNKDTQKQIKLITECVRQEVVNSKEKNISKNADVLIERTVAQLFNLNRNDYKTIFKTLEAADPLIPIKRLLNCNLNDIFK